MLFNTVAFAIFLPVVLSLYWLLSNRPLRYQNLLLLLASYFFYGCWDYRFLLLLFFSTALDYVSGIMIHKARNAGTARMWLWLSISINLGFLAVFKYYNFFIDSFASGLASLGINSSLTTLNIILPVGISFYTFHGLSYIIDIYKQRVTPETDFINYSVFVSFFPLLVAGPIERATHLLPQISKRRLFDRNDFVDGLRQILWGLFKKVVIADQCAAIVDPVFAEPGAYSGADLFLAAVLFSIQLYGDFSGYSDIALGTARLFGIDLLRNFAYPFFSRDIAEFWRRWHISLSSWFRDYVYIPLGGSAKGKAVTLRNVLVVFLLSGLWHGANWTFLLWGLVHALFFIPLLLLNSNRRNLGTVAASGNLPGFRDMLSMGITFLLVVFAFVLFRAESVTAASDYYSNMFSLSLFSLPVSRPITLLFFIWMLFSMEWKGRFELHPLRGTLLPSAGVFRWGLYYFLVFFILYYSGSGQQFIYFQF